MAKSNCNPNRLSSSCGHLRKDAEREDLFDDAQGLDVGFDTVVGKLVVGQALVVELAEAGLIAKKRAIGDVRAPGEKFFNGTVKPNEGGTAVAEEGYVVWLRGGAAAERKNARFSEHERFADGFFELLVLEFAK